MTKSHRVRIRPFEPRDCPAAAALTNRFIRESHTHFGEREQSADEWREMLAHKGGRWPWLTAELEHEGETVFAGYAKAGVWRDRDAYRHTAEVSVYVEQHVERRGVGRSLYTSLFNELATRGIRTAVAGIALPNHGSVRFHEALGFRHVGTFSRVGRKFGRWWDVGFWQLDLASGDAGTWDSD